MSVMVERVRVGIIEAERFGNDRAVAAIKALREPTGAMIETAALTVRPSITDDDIKAIWRAMNDAALK